MKEVAIFKSRKVEKTSQMHKAIFILEGQSALSQVRLSLLWAWVVSRSIQWQHLEIIKQRDGLSMYNVRDRIETSKTNSRKDLS